MPEFPRGKDRDITLNEGPNLEYIPKRDVTLSDADVESIAPLDKRVRTLSDDDVEPISNRVDTLHDADISSLDSDEE